MIHIPSTLNLEPKTLATEHCTLNKVLAVSFSPDGSAVASAGADR